MYNSLHSSLLPLIEEKKNGTLNIFHENNSNGTIALENGRVIGIEADSTTGVKAGQAISLWIMFTSEFHEGVLSNNTHRQGIDVNNFLVLLSKRKEQSEILQKVVPLSNNCFFMLYSHNLKGIKKFNYRELKVALSLDGKTPTKQIAFDTGFADLEVLNYIYGLYRLGLAKRVNAKRPLDEKKRVAFIEALLATLIKLVGPVAGAVLNDALKYLDSDVNLLFESELYQLIEIISNDLEDNDNLAFKAWGLDYLKQL
jgi:hypothetical protein